MITKRHIVHPKLQQFFSWFVRKAFHDLDIRNVEISRYLADLLAEFARSDRVFKVRDARGRALRTIVELLEVREKVLGEKAPGLQRLELDQHIGDYSLFMSGFFIEFLRRGGFVDFYRVEGMKAYRRASDEIRYTGHEGSRLFEDLSLQFDSLSGALQYMRQTCVSRGWQADPGRNLADYLALER
ncbi:MAG: hypothetical protein HYY13_11880 [Nitrospirae bacterium]|nr:hypothetical protein [Nitrospirota bacterium]